MAYEPKKLTPAELAELHALPNEVFLTAREASAFLRLTYGTLAWYRCEGGGPKFNALTPKMLRCSMDKLHDYAKVHG